MAPSAFGGALIDTGYDPAVEYLGFYQLQQANQNSELFYRGTTALGEETQTTVGNIWRLAFSDR